ncbi:MAG: prepilin-type N-terminal cleavage/methylation domain-containing protein [Actinomycetes bacterium]
MLDVTARLRRLHQRRESDAGFTMVEILVSLAILMFVAAALAQLLVVAAQTTNRAKLYTQAKNLVQQQTEAMRNLIYHIDAGSLGSSPSTKLDLLDNYYPNTTAVAAVSPLTALNAPSGWVAAANTGSTYRFSGEPASGSFYRVVNTTTLDHKTYRLVVDTQFLSSGGGSTPVEPPSGYRYDDTSGLDSAPATVVGVTVTAAWTAYSKTKLEQSYTRIDESVASRPTILAQARSALLHVQSNLDSDTSVEADVASVDANGSTATGTTASVNALGGSATETPGSTVTGVSSTLSAPASGTLASLTDANGADLSSGCVVVCFGKTGVTGGPVSISGALPAVGSLGTGGAPITSALLGQGNSGRPTFQFSNNPSDSSGLGLATSSPMVAAVGVSGQPQAGAGAGLYATSGTGHFTDAQVSACFSAVPCVSGASPSTVVQLLPTNFAPQGVVNISLSSAALECKANGTTATVTPSYSATVSYWNGSSYVALATIQPGNTTDPLPTAAQMATLSVGSVSGVTKHLSDYISSWGSAPFNQHINTTSDGSLAIGSVDGIVSLVTQPTRAGDATSEIGLKVGSLSCYAEDQR